MRLRLSVILAVLVIFVFLVPFGLHSDTMNNLKSFNEIQDENYHFVALKNDTGGWYFKILKGEKALIQQKHIPSIMGVKAFTDSLQASKVAQLMVRKLENGVFPPSINLKELDNLRIIY